MPCTMVSEQRCACWYWRGHRQLHPQWLFIDGGDGFARLMGAGNLPRDTVVKGVTRNFFGATTNLKVVVGGLAFRKPFKVRFGMKQTARMG